MGKEEIKKYGYAKSKIASEYPIKKGEQR